MKPLFSAFERRQAKALFEAFAPPAGARAEQLSPKEGEVDYLSPMDKMGHAGTALSRLGMRIGIFVATFAPLWMSLRFRTLRSIEVEERAKYVSRLLRHRVFFVRELTLLLKLVASMGLLGTTTVRARSNYDRSRPEGRKSRALPLVSDKRPSGFPRPSIA